MSLHPSPQVRLMQRDESIILPESLARAVGFVGLDPWMTFVHKVYGFPVYRIAAQLNNELVGWLALVRVRHPLFGDYLTTSPFGSYGGFAYSSISARDVVLEQARALANDLGVEYVNVRFEAEEQTPPTGWIQHPLYATYRLTLMPDADQ